MKIVGDDLKRTDIVRIAIFVDQHCIFDGICAAQTGSGLNARLKPLFSDFSLNPLMMRRCRGVEFGTKPTCGQ